LLTRHTGGSISDEEARRVLESFGAIEEISPISIADQKIANLPEGSWVKFAFFQDCVDARIVCFLPIFSPCLHLTSSQAFNHHEHFRLVIHRPPEPRSSQYRQNNSPPRNSTPARVENQPIAVPRRAPDDHTIFIGDLPLDVTQAQIRHVFSSFGQIVFINVLRKPVEGSKQ
jgi:RNA recognition motif. (a.k.a. RRM, RBD, or RNP domain)